MTYEQELEEKCINLGADIKSLQTLIDGLIGTPDYVTLGDVKFWLNRMHEIAYRNIPKNTFVSSGDGASLNLVRE